MKKLFSIVLCVILLFSLMACGSKKPNFMTDKGREYVVEAIRISDKYIDGDYDEREAKDKINELLSGIRDFENEEYSDDLATTNLVLSISVSLMKDNTVDFIATRNDVAKEIGEPKYSSK